MKFRSGKGGLSGARRLPPGRDRIRKAEEIPQPHNKPGSEKKHLQASATSKWRVGGPTVDFEFRREIERTGFGWKICTRNPISVGGGAPKASRRSQDGIVRNESRRERVAAVRKLGSRQSLIDDCPRWQNCVQGTIATIPDIDYHVLSALQPHECSRPLMRTNCYKNIGGLECLESASGGQRPLDTVS